MNYTDQSEERDLQLLALVMLCELQLEEQASAQELRLLAMAGATEREARAALRGRQWES